MVGFATPAGQPLLHTARQSQEIAAVPSGGAWIGQKGRPRQVCSACPRPPGGWRPAGRGRRQCRQTGSVLCWARCVLLQAPTLRPMLFGGETTRTRQAIRTWQATKGLAETGYLTREQAGTLMALGQEAQEAERAAQAQAEQAAQGRSGGTRTIAEGSRIRWGKSRRMS